jgi:hypothetical protein
MTDNPSQEAPERVWLDEQDAEDVAIDGAAMVEVMESQPSNGPPVVLYLRADTVTPNEVVDALVAALRALEWEPDPDFKADYCLNCGKERRVGHSPACSTGAALSRYEATRQTRDP